MSWWFEKIDLFTPEDVIEHEVCPLCGSREFEPFDVPKEWDDVSWMRCFCGYMFQSPYPTLEAMERFYQSEYRDEVADDEYPMPKDIGVQMTRAARQFQAWGQARPERPKRVLDIGCANGVLLEHAQMYFGSEVFGIELNDRDHELMDEKGIPWGRDLEDVPGKFDLIVLSHVLEHFDFPVDYMKRLKNEVATEQCWVLIEVPTPKSHSAYSKFHFAAFTQEALIRTLALSGWVIRMHMEHGGKDTLQTVIGRLP